MTIYLLYRSILTATDPLRANYSFVVTRGVEKARPTTPSELTSDTNGRIVYSVISCIGSVYRIKPANLDCGIGVLEKLTTFATSIIIVFLSMQILLTKLEHNVGSLYSIVYSRM